MSMMDPMVLGVLYDHGDDSFRTHILDRNQTDLHTIVDRSNRLMSHVIGNSMADYEFRTPPGAEVIDQMGFWRGMSDGFPVYGGPLWCDFEYMLMCINDRYDKKRFMDLYRRFREFTGIRRIICGHTHFSTYKDESVRYRMIKAFLEMDLEYICIDNSCSRAYQSEPGLNGIEIDKTGTIVDKGEVKENWY